MKTFSIGDLVVSVWGETRPLGDDLGVVLSECKEFAYDHPQRNWVVYNVYWFQAGQTYPVVSHDLDLYKEKRK